MTDTQTAPATDDEGDRATFAALGLPPEILRALDDVGYETPSAIQAETIPLLLEGRDIIGLAQTGTGKTAAFALPVLSAIDVARREPQALVLTPTRELAVQVCEAFERYAAHLGGVHVLPIYGGQGYGVQLSALRRGVHVVVGTPGRIMDHLAKGTLDLSSLSHVVLDEADEMLRMGFAEDVDEILQQTPVEKQVALFSATMPRQIRAISQQHLREPAEVTVRASTTTAPSITQRALMVSYQQKLEALTRVLEVEPFEAAIVFTRTRNETETVAERLRARGYAATAISGDVAQPQREKTIDQLRSGDLDVLVATDVAARGLDVERISHVINYDLPIDTESYVHRIGRTGRAGRTGDAISFVTPRERRMLSAIEKATRGTVEIMPMPSAGEVNATRLTRFDEAITAALGETERIERFREIIAHYVAHHDAQQEDVAAALAVVAQGDTPLLLDAEADRALQAPKERDRDRDAGGDRPERSSRRGPSDATTYRLAVGSKRGVEPRQIVGALANEGGLGRDDFGRITIRYDFTLVELPELSPGQLERLSQTRILGVPIDIRVDTGRRERDERGPRRDRDDRAPRRERDERPPRKPRHGRDR
ncbi:DEAD/DEAH box helicase [Agrococcus sp. Marseille-Q4369]|uniref:DEAD/DEAH box helicase n=1 Tax=Agrococcus sp. Marseille-Q4369 TaxID=2810513 RepID=UPI001B8B5101|nr:DEAD/DEAH box helicase [Agrococcus sp. Marseille-Q4369]QUW19250.1 DEAD/DEAH box helicase [Agrococcus sp. Marseille-Q4369]